SQRFFSCLLLCFFICRGFFLFIFFFFSSRRRHTRFKCDWSSDVCSSDLFYIFLTLAVSALVRSSRAALVLLLAFWVATTLIAPRSEERRVGKECRSLWGR